MKEYIKRLRTYPMVTQYGVVTGERYPNDKAIMDKINEVIGYLNTMIGAGLFPLPDGYKED